MADLFYALLIIWVLWRIFGGSIRSTVHHKHTYEQPKKREGDVTITSNPDSRQQKNSDQGEYVDYEEIK